jgi:protein-disulfide isomerase
MLHSRPRILIACFASLLAFAAFATVLTVAKEQKAAVTLQSLETDPDAPVAGNPRGDVTIVAFLDYNCPYCKSSAPALARLMARDHNIRLIYKDWPILGPVSVYSAKIALGAKYQGKYELVHAALMQIPAHAMSRERVDDVVRATGIDIDLLNKDLDRHFDEIVARIRRTNEEAEALGFSGTPIYIIGPFTFAGALDDDGFKQAVTDARARAHAAK